MARLTKILIACGLVAIALVCALTFVPYPPAIDEARAAGFSDDTIQTGLQYAFERRCLGWLYTAVDLGLLSVLALSGLGRRCADRFLALCHGYRILAALCMGLTYVVVNELASLPIAVANFYHSHAWSMSNPDYELLSWLRDHYINFGVNLILEAVIGIGFYAALILLPRVWWLLAPLGMSALAIAYAFLAPILINPLFNDFTPLDQTQWRDQQPRVQALIDRAGIPVQEILVMNASRQGNHTNAYFTGFGSTRRIVLYDTLLKKHNADEIESVLAHEIGHWQHDHIVQGIILGAIASLFGCWVLDRLLRSAVVQPRTPSQQSGQNQYSVVAGEPPIQPAHPPSGDDSSRPWNLASTADPAGVWLVLLLLSLGSWLAMPAENMVTRRFERQADEVALNLGQKPQAFIDCERKMAIDNKSNVAPSPWSVWLFSSHPSTVERIRTAQAWRPLTTE